MPFRRRLKIFSSPIVPLLRHPQKSRNRPARRLAPQPQRIDRRIRSRCRRRRFEAPPGSSDDTLCPAAPTPPPKQSPNASTTHKNFTLPNLRKALKNQFLFKSLGNHRYATDQTILLQPNQALSSRPTSPRFFLRVWRDPGLISASLNSTRPAGVGCRTLSF